MAKIRKRSLDSVRKAPVRRQSYEAPTLRQKRKQVPKEYQTLEKAPKSRGGCLWFLFILFLVAVAGIFYWTKYTNQVSDRSMEFKVSGPANIISGDQITYTVNYKNLDVVKLERVELSVRWPSGFYFDEATVEPLDSKGTTWRLDDLMPGENRTIEIKGQLVGQIDDQLTVLFSMGYQPENFHSDFKEKQTIDTKITDSMIKLEVQSVDKVLVGDEQQYNVVFKNLTKQPIVDLYIDVLYPDDLIISQPDTEEEDSSADEETVEEPNFAINGDYFVVQLEPEEEKVMTFSGIFGPDSKADQKLVVEVGNLHEQNFRRLTRIEKSIVVVNPQFNIDLKINGKETSQTVNWNQSLQYKLEVKNNSGTTITDAYVTALIDGNALDWDTLDTVGKYEESKIVWTSEEDESLSSWSTGESRTFTWGVDVVEEPLAERMIENIVKINIQGLGSWEQVSSPLILTVGESLKFNNGVYWDLGGRRVGSGILPPQVGEKTEYLVVWSLAEATGDFDKVVATTTLPPEVSFVSETDVQEGSLEFDESSRDLVWTLEGFNDLITPITASFTINLEPTAEYKDDVMTVMNPITVRAEGLEEVIVRTKIIKTSDIIADTNEPIGVIQ